jgi:exodeoxyribonuclease V alpha subunit
VSSPQPSAADSLAAAFALQAARWAQRAGADDGQARLAARLARRLSLALTEGHSCLPLPELADLAWDANPAQNLGPANLLARSAEGAACEASFDLEARERVLATGIVGTAEQPGSFPLILDRQGRLYLHRYFDYERRLARRLARVARQPDLPLPEAEVRARLDSLFGADSTAGEIDRQKLAAALALLRRLVLISGGPGTGKTSTVLNLLICVLAVDPQARIVLAAPTGRAAARMQEAIRERAQGLAPELRQRLPAQAVTVHRLLGFDPHRGRCAWHAGRPLPLDMLVVDEASMLDLALATRLCEAVPEHARLILLGDRDQLAAVESGAVFAELARQEGLAPATVQRLAGLAGADVPRLAALAAPAVAGAPAVLRDCVIRFDRQYRFGSESAVGAFAAAIRTGNQVAALDALQRGHPDLRWQEPLAPTSGGPDAELFARLAAGFADYFAVLDAAAAPSEVFAALQGFRVLCAMRSGPWGAEGLAARLSEFARRRLDAPAEAAFVSPWYRGRPVMLLRNDPVLQVFNGDVGIALPDPEGALAVCFPAPGGSFRWLAPVRLPEHQTAWAMTVHKAQGSEFDAVAVVLPPAASPVLTRELLYTAVTRARSSILLVASEERLREAVAAPTLRDSGLLERLREAVASGNDRA